MKMGKTIYTQKFRLKWKSHPKLQSWIMEDETNNTVAYCKYCKCNLKCKLCDLLMHADTKKHITRVLDQCGRLEYLDDEKDDLQDECDENEKESISPSAAKKFRKNARDLQQARQKFCPRWEEQFRWLKPNKIDNTLGVCTICNKYLVCKKSHLERHERSVKHRRMEGLEELDTDTEGEGETARPKDTEFMECGKREFEENELEQEMEMDYSYKDFDITKKSGKGDKNGNDYKSKGDSSNSKLNSNQLKLKQNSAKHPKDKLDRIKLLQLIDRDRHQLNEYFYAKSSATQAQKPRDSFDLFFESVSASVKTFPPKLAAEVKSRVSQIMAEYELRAICDREAHDSLITEATSVVVSTTHEILPVSITPPNDQVKDLAASDIVYKF